ncbi:hypothetical protein MRX96_006426 [Rhipicephalus microplus]
MAVDVLASMSVTLILAALNKGFVDDANVVPTLPIGQENSCESAFPYDNAPCQAEIIGGAENVIATTASAPTVEQPARFNCCGRRCDTDEDSSETKKAKWQTSPDSPVKHCMSPSPTLSCGLRKKCCEFTINNWSSFHSHQARAQIRNGRCECRAAARGRGFSTCTVGGYGFPLLHGARLPEIPVLRMCRFLAK